MDEGVFRREQGCLRETCAVKQILFNVIKCLILELCSFVRPYNINSCLGVFNFEMSH